MSGLIQRLTARALGSAPSSAIRPALIPRFAPSIDTAEPSAQIEHADRPVRAPRASGRVESLVSPRERDGGSETIRSDDEGAARSRRASERDAAAKRTGPAGDHDAAPERTRSTDEDAAVERARPTRDDAAGSERIWPADDTGVASSRTAPADDRDDRFEGIRPVNLDDDAPLPGVSRFLLGPALRVNAESPRPRPRLSLFAQLASPERDRSDLPRLTGTTRGEAEHESIDASPRSTDHDDRAAVASAREVALERLPIARQTMSRTAAPVSGPATSTTATTDAPIVRVTIGRIDVRAVTPPTPQPGPSAPPLRLTLDEYLRQRNGRQR